MPEYTQTTSVIVGDRVRRFSGKMLAQHAILLTLLIVLSFTGLTLMLHDTWIGALMLKLEGGFESRGWIHRTCAIALIIMAVYHFYYIVMTEEGHKELMLLKLNKKDVENFIQQMKFNMGQTAERPKFHKYGFSEKVQYWGLVGGVILIALSGIPLWARNEMMAIMPRWVMLLIHIIHGSEGLLIFLVLFLWHVYNVHLRPGIFPWNPSFITGEITFERLKDDHELEYDELMAADKSKKGGLEGKKQQ